ncbi:MAG: FHA domain-containing protein [Burkholderiales bacterium]|nr:FHA domain-containing protein [Burkholderiales bacterium]
MPELILEVTALDHVFPPPQHVCAINEIGGTVGRDPGNTFVLEDRFRRVSRLHAEITFVRGVPILSNRSATLCVNVGEHEVRPGESAIVQDDDVIEIGPYLLAARVLDERRASLLPQARAVAPPRRVADCETLGAALLDGACLPAAALGAEGLTVELAERIGVLLRHAVQGTMDLLAVRQVTQREAHLGTTLPNEQSNNPLAFLPNADAAMIQLLTAQLPGFMHATRVMPDAFADLLAHDAGVMAGMRATLNEMLVRLDPRQVDAVLAASDGSALPIVASATKARWWDAQSTRVASLLSAADEDFQQAWGATFARAYADVARQTRDATAEQLAAVQRGETHRPWRLDAANDTLIGGGVCLVS